MRTAIVTAFCWCALGLATPPARAEFPLRMPASEAASLPAERETLQGGSGLLVVPRAGEAPAVQGPRGGAPFRARCLVYLAENGIYARRFVIHVPDREGLAFARAAGRFLALLWSGADRRFGTALNRLRADPVDVWLSSSGTAGGEQFGSHILIYDYLDDRTGIEWARELAHEYGHYLLPGAQGYSEPEEWANGVLGERLFLEWLWRDLGAGAVAASDLPWVKPDALAEYRDRQVAPLLARCRALGPQRALLAGTDRRAMDAFTGLILYADQVYGPGALLGMLDYLLPDRSRGARGPDFLDALEAWIAAADRFGVTLDAGPPQMVFLPRGLLTARAEGASLSDLHVRGAAARSEGGKWVVRVPAPGWRAVSVSGSSGRLSLRWTRR